MFSDVHPEALAIADDPSPLVGVVGTRRSGKSRTFIRKMIKVAAATEHARVFYFNETRAEAERIAWRGNGRDGLLTLNQRYKLGGRPKDSTLELFFPNGGIIECIGADDLRAVNKARGVASHLVVIDESQKAPHLDALVEDAVGPGMMDYGGQIILAGTPSENLSGLFYEVTNNEDPRPGWSRHHLNVLSNPFFGETPEIRFKRTVEAYCKMHGLPLEHPKVQREWFGRWVKEDANFTYAVHAVPEHKLCYAEPRWLIPPRIATEGKLKGLPLGGEPDILRSLEDLPPGPRWNFTLFVDLGYFPDPFAYTLYAWSWEWQELLEVASFQDVRLDDDDQFAIMSKIQGLVPLSLVGGDIGGAATPMGKGWAKRWNERYGFALIEAEKPRKYEHIQLFNTDLRKGRIRLRRGSPLHVQMQRVKWLPRTNAKGKLEEDPAIPNDVTDTGLYGHRHTFQFLATRYEPKPKAGTPEYYDRLERQMEEEALAELEREETSYYG